MVLGARLTGSDLGVNLNSRICGDELFWEFHPLVDGDSVLFNVRVSELRSLHEYGLPLANDGIVFHAATRVRVCIKLENGGLISWTYLLMLNIRSIFLMPSQ